jgi:hypothetical protein
MHVAGSLRQEQSPCAPRRAGAALVAGSQAQNCISFLHTDMYLPLPDLVPKDSAPELVSKTFIVSLL